MVTKSSTKKRGGSTSKADKTKVNKSAWIRSQDPSVPAAEVVAKAKQAGIVLSIGQVYTARSTAKRSANGSRAANGTPSAKRASNAEVAFIELVGQLGIAQAQQLLDALKRF